MAAGTDTPDTSPALTVASAAEALEGLLFPDEGENTSPDRESPPAQPPAPLSDDDESEPEAAEDREAEADESEDTPAEDEDDESEPDADEADEDTPAEPRKLRVKVGDEELELPEEEVVKGYQRQADYTRKTQELSAQRKEFEAEKGSVVAERQQYAESLRQIETALTELTPQEPDWLRRAEENPEGWAVEKLQWENHKQQLDAIAKERRVAEEKVAADQRAAYEAHLQSEHEKLLAALPEWREQSVAKAEYGALLDYGERLGFTRDELNAVADHRVVIALRKAQLYDAAQQQRAAVREKVEKVQAKVVPPGPAAGAKRPPVSELTRKKQALAQTGSVHDAAAALMHLID